MGPRAKGAVAGDVSDRSDFGMDRITPKCFDPMGTSLKRYGELPSSAVTEKLSGRKTR